MLHTNSKGSVFIRANTSRGDILSVDTGRVHESGFTIKSTTEPPLLLKPLEHLPCHSSCIICVILVPYLSACSVV